MLTRRVDDFQMELLNMPIHLKISLPLWNTHANLPQGMCRFQIVSGFEYAYISEQNVPHFRQLATQISACIAVFTM